MTLAQPGEGTAPVGGPCWFGRPARPLFGWLHVPDGEPQGAVVLCAPLFAEQSATHPTYQAVARQLAAAGHRVVRFDYEGTGDSAGPGGGPTRVAAWLDGVDQAVAVAQGGHAGLPVALVGMRMGALLAAQAAARRADVDALVLWDPCPSGRAFLRRQQALQALRFPSVADDGGVELPGYCLDPAMADDVSALGLPAVLHARRALVLSRPGRSHPPVELAGGDQAGGDQAGGDLGGGDLGAAVAFGTTELGEQEQLLEVEHLDRRLPAVTAGRVARWVDTALVSLRPAEGAQASSVADPGPPARPAAGGAGTGWSAPGSAAVAMTVEDAWGASVVERVVRVGEAALFGVETRPADGGDDDLPVVLFLSSGSDSHVGPSRLWVTLARRWAAAGLARCVRVDFSGWGESPPRPGRPARVLRAVEAFDDVLEVAEAIGDPRRTVLVGLCSGAYQALESALELRPAGVLAVNPLLRFTPPELREDGVVSDRRRICEAKPPWVRSVRARLPSGLGRVLGAARRVAAGRRSSGQLDAWLADLVRADVRVYCVCGEDDAAPFQCSSQRSRSAWWSSGHLRLDVVPGLDHALLPASQREEVCERFTEELGRIGRAVRWGHGADAVAI